LAKLFALHKSGAMFDKTFPKVTEAFMQKQAKRFGSSMGRRNKTTDELIVCWKPGTTEIYLYMFIEQNYTSGKHTHSVGLDHSMSTFLAVGAELVDAEEDAWSVGSGSSEE
jgi:hypothetical protein